VACGNCGEVADAAVLCPSFYQADIVHNPGAWDKLKNGLAMSVIRFLQNRQNRLAVSFDV
jgi:indolepyruvate ferredoxin oxidoreductase alpha subunit